MGPRVLTWDVGQLHEPCLLLVLPAEQSVQGPAPREVLGHMGGGLPSLEESVGGPALLCFQASAVSTPRHSAPTPAAPLR